MSGTFSHSVFCPQERSTIRHSSGEGVSFDHYCNGNSTFCFSSASLQLRVEMRDVIYEDVPKDAWFSPFVQTLVEDNIARGYRDTDGILIGKFGVGRYISFAESVAMALKAAGVSVGGRQPENISAKGTWAASHIYEAEVRGLSLLQEDIDVHAPASRGAVIHTIFEIFRVPLLTNTPLFSDVSPDHPYAAAIATAEAYGILAGDRDTNGVPVGVFRPDDPMNRAEVSKLITLIRKTFQAR